METVTDFIFLGSKIMAADGDYSHEFFFFFFFSHELKTLAPWKKSSDHPRWHIKKQRHYFADKGRSSQSFGLSSSHAWMQELDLKES